MNKPMKIVFVILFAFSYFLWAVVILGRHYTIIAAKLVYHILSEDIFPGIPTDYQIDFAAGPYIENASAYAVKPNDDPNPLSVDSVETVTTLTTAVIQEVTSNASRDVIANGDPNLLSTDAVGTVLTSTTTVVQEVNPNASEDVIASSDPNPSSTDRVGRVTTSTTIPGTALKKDIADKRSQRTSSSGSSSSARSQGNAMSQPRPNQNFQMRRNGQGPLTCFQCGELGHKRQDCPNRQQPSNGVKKPVSNIQPRNGSPQAFRNRMQNPTTQADKMRAGLRNYNALAQNNAAVETRRPPPPVAAGWDNVQDRVRRGDQRDYIKHEAAQMNAPVAPVEYIVKHVIRKKE
jgi:hypothetical protein